MEPLAITGAIVGIALLAVAGWHSESWLRRRKMENAFAGRESLDAVQFYEKYFRAEGVPERVVLGVRKVLEEQLLADMSRLADTDDFSKNLGFFFEFDSMADVEIICALEEEFAIRIADNEAENTRTIRDIIHLVCQKQGHEIAT